MKALQILPQLVVGGVETGTVDFAAALVERGHEAVVVSNGGPLEGRLKSLGVKHYKLPVHKKSIFSIVKCIKELQGILKEEEVDVVHARSRVPAIIAALAIRRLIAGNLKAYLPVFITTCHGYYSSHIFSRPMGWGKFVITSSNIIARHMMEDFKVPFQRIKFIPRGVDLSRFKFVPPSERNNQVQAIVMIGRITPIKGHQFFIKAAAKVVKILPKTKIFIVGRPPEGKEIYLRQLKLLAERLGILDSIEFQGHRQDIPDVLLKMDVLVFSSVGHESFGRAAIEAQAAGVPVVATKVGGLTDIITDRETGILVAPENAGQLADAIIELLKDKALSEKLAQQARRNVQEKFTLDIMADKTISVYHQALEGIRILVIKIGAFGDVVLVTPSLRAIRERFPKAHIAVLVGVESRQILQNCPYVDELIIYNRPFINPALSKWERIIWARKGGVNLRSLACDLRKYGFDIVIDFQNSWRSHMLSFLSLAPKRFGYKNKKLGILLNYGIEDSVPAAIAPVEHQFRILNLLEIQLKDKSLEVWPAENDYSFIDEFLSGEWVVANQPLVGINIGGSLRWRTKRWPPDMLLGLCDELAKRNIRVVLTGVKQDQALAGEIAAASRSKPINAVGKTTLNQLAALVKRCRVFISTDSAPMHIAAAVWVPIVAIFGPTDPGRHSPPAEKIVIIRKKIKCSPCYKPDCKKLTCMKEIQVEEIADAVNGFLRPQETVL